MFTDHKSSLDNMSHSQIRVVLEHLLMTMDIKQRRKLIDTFPGLYYIIYPESKPEVKV
jgi:hypothetical protein